MAVCCSSASDSSRVLASTFRSRPAYDSRSWSAMVLNRPARASSSSPVSTRSRWPSSPAPIRAAPVASSWMGFTMRRASRMLATIESAMPSTRGTTGPGYLEVESSRRPLASAARRRGSTPWRAPPAAALITCRPSEVAPDGRHRIPRIPLARERSAAATWGRDVRSVFMSTRLMSGCAINPPFGVGHEGVALLAGSRVRDQLPDELQVHLGEGHHAEAGAGRDTVM